MKYYYLFVNTDSGEGVGKQYLTLKDKGIKFKIGTQTVNIFIYDIFLETDRVKGLTEVQNQTKLSEVTVVICGGDGTVFWVLTEILNSEIQTDRVTFSVIPIGTGNDFSRTIGWGFQPIHFNINDTENLKRLVFQWEHAEKKKYDLWDIHITTASNGKIISLRDKQIQNQNVQVLRKTFTNYFGIGVDGRTSFISENNRGSNWILNRLIYACVGCLCIFNPAPSMKKLFKKFNQSFKKKQNNQTTQMTMHEESFKETPSQSIKDITLLNQDEGQSVKLKNSWHCMVFLNGKNFMGGVSNIWKKKYSRQQVQEYDDGKIEVVGFRNQFSLFMQRSLNVASNVTQSQGPFEIQFTQSQGKQVKTYIQIDGEPMILINPKRMTIKHSQMVKNGKINVLVNSTH